jgi:hypothetical protein
MKINKRLDTQVRFVILLTCTCVKSYARSPSPTNIPISASTTSHLPIEALPKLLKPSFTHYTMRITVSGSNMHMHNNFRPLYKVNGGPDQPVFNSEKSQEVQEQYEALVDPARGRTTIEILFSDTPTMKRGPPSTIPDANLCFLQLATTSAALA